MPRNVADWANNVLQSGTGHVDPHIPSGKEFTSSSTIVIAAHKGQYSATTGSFVKDVGADGAPGPADFETIGVVQNATVAQNKQLAQIFEIGSHESYFVPGRAVVQASLSRVMIDGDSLMKTMYPSETAEGFPAGPGFKRDTLVTTAAGDISVQKHFFINLADVFFNAPLDLAFFFYDGSGQAMGGFYLKDAHIQAHQISLASQQTVVLENITLRANKVIGMSI